MMSTGQATAPQTEEAVSLAPGSAPRMLPAGYPASPLVLAAVAGAVFALVLFSVVTIGTPSEFVWALVLQTLSMYTGNVGMTRRTSGTDTASCDMARTFAPDAMPEAFEAAWRLDARRTRAH